MVQIDKLLLLGFGISFFLGMFLASAGAWWLWRRAKKIRHKELKG